MTVATHTVVGAAIGFSLGNPILGFVIGFVSHFLIDMIPHGDHALSNEYRIHGNKKLPVTYLWTDIFISIFMLLLLFNVVPYENKLAFTAAIAGSIIPDIIIGIYELTKSKHLRWFFDLHFWFHDFFIKKYGDVKLRYSLLGQASLVILLISFIN